MLRNNFISLCFFIIISGVLLDREFYIGCEFQTNVDDTIDEDSYILAGEHHEGIVV